MSARPACGWGGGVGESTRREHFPSQPRQLQRGTRGLFLASVLPPSPAPGAGPSQPWLPPWVWPVAVWLHFGRQGRGAGLGQVSGRGEAGPDSGMTPLPRVTEARHKVRVSWDARVQAQDTDGAASHCLLWN